MKITISYAQTLDGRIATRTGDSQWIGGPESLRVAHQLRATHDAVLVGVGTIVTDNPRLTTRLVEGPSPVRVVADSGLRIPLSASILHDGAARTLLATTQRTDPDRAQALRSVGVEVMVVAGDARGRVDLHDLVRRLESMGIGSILVEGGAAIITSILRAGLADRMVVCVAPRVVGAGIEAVGDLGIQRLQDALSLANVKVIACGSDLILDGELAGIASLAG